MNCPVDRTTLKETVVENVILQQCPKCGGLWLPTTALKQFSQLHGIDVSSLKYNLDKNTCNINKQILCPSDNSRMILYPFHGVEIDICASCWGIWLDGGELELILKKTKKSWGKTALEFGCECVEDGNIFTSAGISAGIDMSLHLVKILHSPILSEKTARQMEYEPG